MTHDGLILIKMGRNRVPHVTHFNLRAIAQARVPFLRALMTLILVTTRPDARGGWHVGCAYWV